MLIHDEGPRISWKLGKIICLLPGPDGITRVVQLRTGNGKVIRPTVKLYPLEQSLEPVPTADRAPLSPAVPDQSGGGNTTCPTRQAALASMQGWRERIRGGLV